MASVSVAIENCRNALGDAADIIRGELERGECQAFRIKDCTVIVRQEEKTLVVVAIEGKGIRPIIRAIHANGKKSGFTDWRCHCRDPRLARIVKRTFDWDAEARDAENYIVIYGSF